MPSSGLSSSSTSGETRSRQLTGLALDPSVAYNPRHLLRSRSLSPSSSTSTYPKAYTVVGATQCGVVIGPPTFSRKPSLNVSPSPTFITNPFISTRSRPTLYQRANSGSSNSLSPRGRSRSRSSAPSPAFRSATPATTLISSPSFASAMMPPMAPLSSQVSYNEDTSHKGSNDSSRLPSPTPSERSMTTGSAGTKRGLITKLKSLVKQNDGKDVTVVYMTPEEARLRELKIKKAFGGGSMVIQKGAMGM